MDHLQRKTTKKRIMISYCFGILDVTVLEDMMPVHPSRRNVIRKMSFPWSEREKFITFAFNIPN